MDYFYNEIQSYSAYVPYMMSPGNHVGIRLHSLLRPLFHTMYCKQEAIYNFTAYINRVSTSMPTAASGSNSPFWYSYNYGNVHFIAFSIEQPYGKEDPQGIWLMNDILEASRPENRVIRPWIVAFAHRPMWCSNDVCKSMFISLH